jgi:hypothetical protein
MNPARRECFAPELNHRACVGGMRKSLCNLGLQKLAVAAPISAFFRRTKAKDKQTCEAGRVDRVGRIFFLGFCRGNK